MFLSLAITLAIVAVVSLLLYSRQRHQYWAKRGIWSPKGLPVFGHMLDMFLKKDRWEYIDKIYCQVKEKKYWGMYTIFNPSLVITDPEILKLIFVKDADSFTDRPFFELGEKDKIFKEFLTLLRGDKWKALRSIISPTFTSGKIKGTFPLISESVETLLINCQQKMEDDGYVEMKTMMGNYSLDVITNCALGIRVDCYSGKKSEFVDACYEIMNPTLFDAFQIAVLTISEKLYLALGFCFTKNGIKVLEKSILQTIETRQHSNTKRGDFLDLLLEAQKNHEENKSCQYPMTMDTIVSSSILFILAGYDTTSTTLSFATYLLANNTDCQDELRRELQAIVEADGEMNYQNIMEAKYLDACIFETLRMYGPAHNLERCCTRDYKVPSEDLLIPKGMAISVPSWSLQYDPQYWDEPREFQPNRFLPENKQNINPYTFFGFGQGPRNCIGMRFALLKAKMAIAHLVLKYEISLKPGFELGLAAGLNVLKPDSNGVPVILEQFDLDLQSDESLSGSDSQSD